jgi:lipopolysaccharide export LptBFGC system permease protein LptF
MPTLEYVMPAALLLGTIYTLWHLSRHGELTAMRASGMSMMGLMAPFLAVGFAFSVATSLLEEFVVPRLGFWASQFYEDRFQHKAHKIYHDRAHYDSVGRRLWLIETFDLKRPDRLVGVKVSQERPDGSLERETYADTAEWLDGKWWFFNVSVQRYTPQGTPIGRLETVKASERGVEMPLLTETPTCFINEVKDWEHLSYREMKQYLHSHPFLSADLVARKRVDMQMHLAMPWACLIVTLFGIPAGVRGARESVITGILLTVGCFFVFYSLQQVGGFVAKRQLVSPWIGAWFANVVFLIVGTRMLFRIR